MNTRTHYRDDRFSAFGGPWHAAALLLLAAALASGCASAKGAKAAPPANAPGEGGLIEPTVVGTAKYRDPLIRMNRVIFKFNDVAYRHLLIPLGKGYMRLLPDPAHRSVGNFFHNIKTPIYVVNDVLQLKPKPLGRHLSRFVVNSTVGLAGLFDPAKAWLGLERTQTGFEDTLAGYGVGYGFYLVLPVFGSSSARNGAALVADYFLNPIPYLTENPATTAIMSYDNFQQFAPSADKYEILRRKLDDPYIFFRNLYLQGVERDADR